MNRILWVAVADARGHLMRAHLARKLLARDGLAVEVVTTTDDGVRFLRALGTPALRLGRGYSLAFDAQQNLDRDETDLRLLRYLFDPLAMLADLRGLAAMAGCHTLVVNDSFHPALTLAPLLAPELRIVHVYGEHMLEAVARHHDARLPPLLARRYAVALRALCARSFARIEHTLAPDPRSDPAARYFRLPPLIGAPARAMPAEKRSKSAVVYLNPHFRDPALADAIERALATAGFTMHAVGEGFADRPGWRACEPRLVDYVQAADLVVSAPGMGTLAQVRAFGTPFLALVTDQAEQRLNLAYLDPTNTIALEAARLAELSDAVALLATSPRSPRGLDPIRAQHDAWRMAFSRILNGIYSNEQNETQNLPHHRDHQPARWWRRPRATDREPRAVARAPHRADVFALSALGAHGHALRCRSSG